MANIDAIWKYDSVVGNLAKWAGGVASFVSLMAIGFNDSGCTVFFWLDVFPFLLLVAAHAILVLVPCQRGAQLSCKIVLSGILLVAYVAAEACVIFNEKLHDYTCTSVSGQPPVVVTNKTVVRVALFFVVLFFGLSSQDFRAWLVWCQQQELCSKPPPIFFVGVDGVRETMEEHTKHFTEAELVRLEHTVLCALRRLCHDTPVANERDAKLKLDRVVLDGVKRVHDLRATAHGHYVSLIEQIQRVECVM